MVACAITREMIKIVMKFPRIFIAIYLLMWNYCENFPPWKQQNESKKIYNFKKKTTKIIGKTEGKSFHSIKYTIWSRKNTERVLSFFYIISQFIFTQFIHSGAAKQHEEEKNLMCNYYQRTFPFQFNFLHLFCWIENNKTSTRSWVESS
jgi:hypothetical protein